MKRSLKQSVGWTEVPIEQLFAPLEDGRTLHQGWSPQCDKMPSPSEDVWGVLKTTAIQAGEFQPEYNKLLPTGLEPRPLIEVKEGDILITCAGPRVRCGVSCLVRQTRKRLMMSGKMYRFRVDPSRTDARYVETFLQTERARLAIDKMKTGSSDSGLNLTHDRFRQLPIPVAPLPEQRRIVAEVEKQFTRLDAGVAALRRTQANLKRYRAAVLKAACEGRLVLTEAELARKERRDSENGNDALVRVLKKRRALWTARGTYKEPPTAETTELEEIPVGWTWSSLAQLATHITDGTHKTPTYIESGVPFLSAKDITGFKITFDECRYIPRSEHEELSKRCATRSGNVLITKSGTIGRVAVVRTDKEFSLFESVANVPVIEPINPEFVAYAAFVGIAGVFGVSNQKGVAVRHLHLEDLRRVPIPLPPVAEQRRIVAEVERRLSVVEELEAVVAANLLRANRLRQTVLQRAFTGKQKPAS